MPSRRAGLAVLALACASACARPSAEPGDVVHQDVELVSDTDLTPGHVRPGENFGTLLASQQIGRDQLEAMLASLEGVFDPRRMHEGQAWRLLRTGDGLVRQFEYEIDGRSVLRITPNADTAGEFVAEVVPYNVRVTRVEVSGNINGETSSLFAAMSSAGEQPDLSVALADIFSGEVDFNTDLQPGDSFHLITEKAVRDGRFVGYGPVAAAELVNEGRHLVAFRFQPSGAPLKFDPQVSSGFSRSRLHPILNIRRAHLGVDYRAPIGAPVVAVSDGAVTFAGWTSGGGRTVRIRHASGYESGYLHLSAIGPGIRAGVRVSQGQVIGKVGMTGLATGPHLHYELRKAGAVVNPMSEHKKLPPGEPIPPGEMEAFKAARDAAAQTLGWRL
jgi:murein DD-endopeptidase MepM/ murein hydrolase activator NlpD